MLSRNSALSTATVSRGGRPGFTVAGFSATAGRPAGKESSGAHAELLVPVLSGCGSTLGRHEQTVEHGAGNMSSARETTVNPSAILEDWAKKPFVQRALEHPDDALDGLGVPLADAMRLYDVALHYQTEANGTSGAVEQHHWKRRAMYYLMKLHERGQDDPAS